MDRPCQIEQPDCLPSESTTARAWYGGDKPAASAVLRAAASEEVETILLYAIEEGLQSGADLALVQGLCDKLCDPDMGRLWTGPQALQHLLTALFDLVPSLLERVRVLEKIGAFTLAPELPAAAKKAQV